MIWNGSTERHWWKPSDYNGCKVQVDGVWQSIDWNNRDHIKTYVEAIRAAGINAIVADMTNGFRWQWQARYVQELCAEHGMKFAIAFNPQAGREMESGCRQVWQTYAAPGVEHAEAYLHIDGKPLVVLYTWRAGYEASNAQEGEFRLKFSTVWASGEDSDKDKWGWQLEPHVGPVPSTKAMFVTGSVKFDSPRTAEDRWRRHMAWLDYGFILARRNRPHYLIVGSFDDVHERNAWLEADTANAERGWQMRDITGAISTDAWYRRVREWVLRGKPAVVAGGLIRDGAYRVTGADDRVLSVTENRPALSPVVLAENADHLNHYLWFYHLGDQVYRIIKLNAGMPLDAIEGKACINWDSEAPSQRWRARRIDDTFVFINQASGDALDQEGETVVTRAFDETSLTQRWKLVEAVTVPQ